MKLSSAPTSPTHLETAVLASKQEDNSEATSETLETSHDNNTIHSEESPTNDKKSFKSFQFSPSPQEDAILRSVWTSIGNYDPFVDTPKRHYIPILEGRGGTDKDPATGHRRDSVPIAESIAADGEEHQVGCAIFQYLEDQANPQAAQTNDLLRRHLLAHATGLVVRVNPGTLSPACQMQLDNMLIELGAAGICILSSPVVQKTMGAKDALYKIRELKSGMHDTAVYYDSAALEQGFCATIAQGPRVIKQNRGSQGEGIWIIKLADESQYGKFQSAPLDTPLVLVEANDNHTEYHTVGEFLDFCTHGRSSEETGTKWTSTGTGRYLEGGADMGAMLVDQRFLPRIVEGEVRCLMIGPELVSIVHKVPQEGTLSATLQSGACYTHYPPDHPKFTKLVANFLEDLPRIMSCFGLANEPLPLLWTTDFIFGNGDECFVGEFNCSCVGITQQLELAPIVARSVVQTCCVGLA